MRKNVTCPKCGREYSAAGCFECVACSHAWNEGDDMAYQSRLAEWASFDRRLIQLNEDYYRLTGGRVTVKGAE